MSRPWNRPRKGPSNQADHPPRWLSAAAATALAMVAFGVNAWILPASCASRGISSGSSPSGGTSTEYDLTCLAAFDISGSMSETEKRTAYQFVSQLLAVAVQQKAQMPIWEYAETCAQRAELDVEFRKDVMGQLESLMHSKRGVYGTFPSLALNEFKKFLDSGRNKSSRVVLLLVTDGEMHDRTKAAELCQELAESRQVRALVVGPVDSDQWMQVGETFSKFGTKLVIFGASDRRRALEDVLRLLEKGDTE